MPPRIVTLRRLNTSLPARQPASPDAQLDHQSLLKMKQLDLAYPHEPPSLLVLARPAFHRTPSHLHPLLAVGVEAHDDGHSLPMTLP